MRLIALALAGFVLPAAADTVFGGPAFLEFEYFNAAQPGFFTWDFSGLHVADTANGLSISGSLTGSIDAAFGSEIVGSLYVIGRRPVSAAPGTPVKTSAHLTLNSIATTGSLHVYNVGVASYMTIGGGASSCLVGASDSDGNPNHVSTGPLSLGPVSSTCEVPAGINQHFQTYGIFTFILNDGPSTLSIDLGNSISGSATAVPSAVPEPAALWTLVPTIAGLWTVRRYRSRVQS